MLKLAENETTELRETVKFLEQELNKSRDQNSALVSRYEKLQEEIQHSHEQIARQATISHSQVDEIERLKQTIKNHSGDNELKRQIEEYKFQLAEKDEIIEKYMNVINSQQEDSEGKFVNSEQAKIRIEEVNNEIVGKDRNLESLQNRLKEAYQVIEEMKRKLRSEATSMLENDHLRADNARLVNLLKGTKEYYNFAEYIEDSNGVINVPIKYKNCPKHCGSIMNRDQYEDWVPSEAFKIAQGLKVTPLTDEIINKVLLELNKVWREREKRQVDRLKAKYSLEMSDLKRQLAMRVPFIEVQANKHIAKLRAEIRTLQRDAKIASKLPTKERQKIGVVDEALKMAGSLQRQNADFSERNATLLKRVKELELLVTGEDYEKQKFMEGGSWISQRIIEELDKYGEQLNDLINEYNKRTEEKDVNGEIDALFVSTTQAWLLESIDQAFQKLSEKIKAINESTKYHSATSGEKVRSITETIRSKGKSKSYLNEIEGRVNESIDNA